MRLRHAAALALTGWYLMVPSMGSDHKLHVEASLSQYQREGSYNSAHECEVAAVALKRAQAAELDRANSDPNRRWGEGAFDIFSRGRCVADDDPRLKEK